MKFFRLINVNEGESIANSLSNKSKNHLLLSENLVNRRIDCKRVIKTSIKYDDAIFTIQIGKFEALKQSLNKKLI